MISVSRFQKTWHKTPFWSQFVFGLIAIFALPEFQGQVAENEQTVINQSFSQCQQCADELEQIFLAELPPQPTELVEQAVIFGEFFAKSYRFDGDSNHPIRAGPTHL